jgi:hypothetical protein
MGLFGPLGSVIYGHAPPALSSGLYGTDPDAVDYAMQLGVPRPLPIPNQYLWPWQLPDTGTTAVNTAVASATAATPAQAPAPPLPSMQSLGTLTTRRTQLFGPLGSVSI